jgi:lactoylglutathione lyase
MNSSLPHSGSSSDQQKGGLLPFSPLVGMVSYRVADIERSLSFYIDVLGMKERLRLPGFGEGEREIILEYPGMPGAVLMLMWNMHSSRGYEIGTGYNRLTIFVSDARGAVRHLVDHHVPVLIPVTETNGVHFAIVSDPDGYLIELLQLG